MASTYLTRTFGAGNRRTWTFSAWIKRNEISSTQTIMAQNSGWQGSGEGALVFDGDDNLSTYNLLADLNNGTSSRVQTNRVFRDVNAWYHIVLRFDSTQATSSDRVRWYVNGVQETSLKYAFYPAQNYEPSFNRSTRVHGIGGHPTGSTMPNGCQMSHVHFCDGYSYDASAFGSTDSTTGEWKINTSPSVSYGTTGFTILKDGITITDQSANSNNFTVAGGTLTKTEDNPSNVFATFNPLSYRNNDSQRYVTFSEGNNTAIGNNSANNGNAYSSLGASSGKFYCEIKATDVRGTGYPNIGFMSEAGANRTNGGSGQITTAGGTAYLPNGRLVVDSSETASWGASFTDNDIIQLAMDLDNGALYFGKNGTWQNSGNPASGASKTGAARSFTPDGTFQFFGVAVYESGCQVKANFGNGYFGTIAVSSAGTNASGIGIFEYDVPTGFTALSTKGLNL